MTIVDLHIHSNFSDGSDSIEDLAKKIKLAGIKYFALTDHDTVAGCKLMDTIITDEIKFIPSVELTCKAGDIKCHILGYNCDYNNKTLLDLIEKGKQLRKHKLETRLNYLKEVWDIELTKEELDWLYSRKSVVKTHIANILVNRDLAPNNVSAMKKYLDGCKSGDTRFSGEEAINAITQSGGTPIWAHPLGGEGETHISEKEFLEKLEKMKSFGIRGIECYYSRYDFNEIDFLVKVAKEQNLLITGGSDYHGTNKDIPLTRLNSSNKKIAAQNLTLLNEILKKDAEKVEK